MLDEGELYVLSYYRACELAGSLLFGKLAFHTTIDEYRHRLTEHALEEARHAWLWGETIQRLGRAPLRVVRTYQGEYGKRYGMPQSMLEVFCLTQVFERRTLDHFTRHLRRPELHEEVRVTLGAMIADEEGHLDWIARELEAYSARHGAERVTDLMARLVAIDTEVYGEVLGWEPFRTYFGPWIGDPEGGAEALARGEVGG